MCGGAGLMTQKLHHQKESSLFTCASATHLPHLAIPAAEHRPGGKCLPLRWPDATPAGSSLDVQYRHNHMIQDSRAHTCWFGGPVPAKVS
jgi:hypothetical protein